MGRRGVNAERLRGDPRLVASDFYLLHNPSFCERRIYLDQQGIPKPPLSPFQQLLFELGKRHERNHLAILGACADLSQGSEEKRERATREAVEQRAGVIYQPT